MLIFPLKKEWYEKIRSGEKTVEYREVKPYWTRRLQKAEFADSDYHWDFQKRTYIFTKYSAPAILQLGYTKERLEAWITKIEIINGKDTDLHIDKPVYAIHLANVKEVSNGKIHIGKGFTDSCVIGSKESMECVNKRHKDYVPNWK